MNNIASLAIVVLISSLTAGGQSAACCTQYDDVKCVMCEFKFSLAEACQACPTCKGCGLADVWGYLLNQDNDITMVKQDYLQKADALSNYLQKADAKSTYLGKGDAAANYATKAYVTSQNYATQAQVTQEANAATAKAKKFVSQQDYATEDYIQMQGYATQSYVQRQGYASKSYVNSYVSGQGYATTRWVGNQGYVNGNWVNNQGFMKKTDMKFYETVYKVSTGSKSHVKKTLIVQDDGYCSLSGTDVRIEAYGDIDDRHYCRLSKVQSGNKYYYVLEAYAKDGGYSYYYSQTDCEATCYKF